MLIITLCLVTLAAAACGTASLTEELDSSPQVADGVAPASPSADSLATSAPTDTQDPAPATTASTTEQEPGAEPTTTLESDPPANEEPTATARATPSRTPPPSNPEEESEYEIITLLPFDAISAILDPEFLGPAEAAEVYDDFESVLGLSINGDHRAYPIPFLSRHEIVNDIVGGQPVAVTW